MKNKTWIHGSIIYRDQPILVCKIINDPQTIGDRYYAKIVLDEIVEISTIVSSCSQQEAERTLLDILHNFIGDDSNEPIL